MYNKTIWVTQNTISLRKRKTTNDKEWFIVLSVLTMKGRMTKKIKWNLNI